MEPITRQEQLLDSIATGNSVDLEPITREEQYLSAIAGLTDFIPEKPITRKEMFYQKILESGGGGGSNTLKNIVAPTDTTGLERVVIIEGEEQSMIYYRVADFVPFDRYKGCEILCRLEPEASLEWITGGEEGETAKLLETGSYTDAYSGLIGVAQDNETIEISDGMAFTFPKAGIYFLGLNDSFMVQEVVFAELTQSKTIEVTENGTYKVTPDSGKVLSSVTAKVNVPERYDEGFAEGKEQGLSQGYASGFGAGVNSVKLQEKTATENGDVLPDEGFSGMSKVIVDVPTSGGGKEEQEKTVTITENGTTEVTPDEGKTLSKVTVETNVAGSGGGSDEAIKAVVEGGATEIILPNSVNKMRDYSFYNYTSLITVKAAGITSIGMQAFYNCTNLALTELPAEITSIGDSAFDGCKNLALTALPAEITSIGDSAFRSCKKLVLTELPAGITSIGMQAFYNCTNLALTELPAGITTIEANTFRKCTNLALTELPAGITSIGSNAFSDCTNLKTITFKGKPTSISSDAFYRCTNITTINVPWAEGAVANAPWGATNATINYNYTGV